MADEEKNKEKSEEKRKKFGTFYLLLGSIFIFCSSLLIWPRLLVFLSDKIIINAILWCIGWSCVGVGACLINTRDHLQDEHLHLIGYWGFVTLVVSAFSFVVALYKSGENYPILNIKFYSLSALLGLIVGFCGDNLRELTLGAIKRFNDK